MDHISYLTTMFMTAGTSWLICDLILTLSMSEIRGWISFGCLGGAGLLYVFHCLLLYSGSYGTGLKDINRL